MSGCIADAKGVIVMAQIPERVAEMLVRDHVSFRLVPHLRDYTAQQTAGHMHMRHGRFVKTVIIVADGRYMMVVMPAHHRLSWDKIRAHLGTREVHMASEDELRMLFPDCELGAEPPFGEVYHLPVLASEELVREGELAFNGGTHEQAMVMEASEFARIVNPRWIDISRPESENAIH